MKNRDEGQKVAPSPLMNCIQRYLNYHRLCVVYRVVSLLVYFEPAAMCDMPTDLLIAPLPARKQLWEAADEFAWKAEIEKGAEIFGLAANGELVRIGQDQTHCSEVRLPGDTESSSNVSSSWEEWCSGMDALGGLVMLAASSIG